MGKLNPTKAVEAVLYVATKLGSPADVYATLKAIYFADKEHLKDFGRLMFGESYYAMEHGPVPSATYDLIKAVGGRVPYSFAFPGASDALFANNLQVFAKREPNVDQFSRSELMCLDRGIDAVRGRTFNQIRQSSHDQAWRRADNNGEIPLEEIAAMLDPEGRLSQHLADRFPG